MTLFQGIWLGSGLISYILLMRIIRDHNGHLDAFDIICPAMGLWILGPIGFGLVWMIHSTFRGDKYFKK